MGFEGGKKIRNALAGAASVLAAGAADVPPAVAQGTLQAPRTEPAPVKMLKDLQDMQKLLGGYVEQLPPGAQKFTGDQVRSFVPEKGIFLTDLIRKLVPDAQMQDYDASKESLFERDRKVVFIEYKDAKGKFYFRQLMGKFSSDIMSSDPKSAHNPVVNIEAIYVVRDNWEKREVK